MSRGPLYTKHLDDTLKREIYETQIPNIEFLYEHSSTKNPEYNIGDRVLLPDGRVFRYGLMANSGQECSKGVKFGGTMADHGIALCSPAKAEDIGATSFTVASQTFAVDELRGGYCCLYTAGSTYQQFGIVGNSAASASTVTIYLDHPMTTALGATNGIEVLPNPYRYLTYINDVDYNSVAGIPVSVPASGEYFWIQTWGPVWCNPGPYGQGGAATERTLIFWTDGQLRVASDGYDSMQRAGFLMTRDALGTDSPPFLMLQISV